MTELTVDMLEHELMHAKIVIDSLQQHIKSSAKVAHEIVSYTSTDSADTLRDYILGSYWLTPFAELQRKLEENHDN